MNVLSRGRDRDNDNDRDRFREDRLDSTIISPSQALQAALIKFNTINNAHYSYQYQQSCSNCPICDIQAMNVEIVENVVTNIEFAEGNDFALTHFCSNDTDILQQRLVDAQLSIIDIFKLINESMISEYTANVLYDEDYGIPLSISIDQSTETINDEIFIAINCIDFDTAFEPVIESVNSSRDRRRNRRETAIDIETVNKALSCQNISGIICIQTTNIN